MNVVLYYRKEFEMCASEISPIDIVELREEHVLAGGFFGTLHRFKSAEALSLCDARRIFWAIKQMRCQDVYVALCEGRVVGTITLLIRHTLLHSRPVGYVEDVAVHEQFSGQGIFRKLCDFVRMKAQSHNCYKLILNCEHENIALYERLGFRVCDVGMRIDL